MNALTALNGFGAAESTPTPTGWNWSALVNPVTSLIQSGAGYLTGLMNKDLFGNPWGVGSVTTPGGTVTTSGGVTGQQSFFTRNSAWIVPAAVVGVGAAVLLARRRR
jgi:hypothetical protein